MKTEKLNTLLRDVSNVRDPVKQVNWKSKNHPNDYEDTEAVVRRCSVRKVSLEISQNSQESTWVRNSFLIKLQDLKKSLWHRCFHVNVAKFLRTPFLTEHLRWLLPLVRKCFSSKMNSWIPLISIMVFNNRKIALNKSILFPLNRK